MSIATLPLSPAGPFGAGRCLTVHTHEQGCLIHSNADAGQCEITILVPLRLASCSDRFAAALLQRLLSRQVDCGHGMHGRSLKNHCASHILSQPRVRIYPRSEALEVYFSAPSVLIEKKKAILAEVLIMALSSIFYCGDFHYLTVDFLQEAIQALDAAFLETLLHDSLYDRHSIANIDHGVRLEKDFIAKCKKNLRDYHSTVVKSAPFFVIVSTHDATVPLKLLDEIKKWCTRTTDESPGFHAEGLKRGCQVGASVCTNRGTYLLKETVTSLSVEKCVVYRVVRDGRECTWFGDLILYSARFPVTSIFNINLMRLVLTWFSEQSRLMMAIYSSSSHAAYLQKGLIGTLVRYRDWVDNKICHVELYFEKIPLLYIELLKNAIQPFQLWPALVAYFREHVESFREYLASVRDDYISRFMMDPHGTFLDDTVPFFMSACIDANGHPGTNHLSPDDVYGPHVFLSGAYSTLYDIWSSRTEALLHRPTIQANPLLSPSTIKDYLEPNIRTAVLEISDTLNEQSKFIDTGATGGRPHSISLNTSVYRYDRDISVSLAVADTLTSAFVLSKYSNFCGLILGSFAAPLRISVALLGKPIVLEQLVCEFIHLLFSGAWGVYVLIDKATNIPALLELAHNKPSRVFRPFKPVVNYYLRRTDATLTFRNPLAELPEFPLPNIGKYVTPDVDRWVAAAAEASSAETTSTSHEFTLPLLEQCLSQIKHPAGPKYLCSTDPCLKELFGEPLARLITQSREIDSPTGISFLGRVTDISNAVYYERVISRRHIGDDRLTALWRIPNMSVISSLQLARYIDMTLGDVKYPVDALNLEEHVAGSFKVHEERQMDPDLPGVLSTTSLYNDIEHSFKVYLDFDISHLVSLGPSLDIYRFLTQYLRRLSNSTRDVKFMLIFGATFVRVIVTARTLRRFERALQNFFKILAVSRPSTNVILFHFGGTRLLHFYSRLASELFVSKKVSSHLFVDSLNFYMVGADSSIKGVIDSINQNKATLGYYTTVLAARIVLGVLRALPRLADPIDLSSREKISCVSSVSYASMVRVTTSLLSIYDPDEEQGTYRGFLRDALTNLLKFALRSNPGVIKVVIEPYVGFAGREQCELLSITVANGDLGKMLKQMENLPELISNLISKTPEYAKIRSALTMLSNHQEFITMKHIHRYIKILGKPMPPAKSSLSTMIVYVSNRLSKDQLSSGFRRFQRPIDEIIASPELSEYTEKMVHAKKNTISKLSAERLDELRSLQRRIEKLKQDRDSLLTALTERMNGQTEIHEGQQLILERKTLEERLHKRNVLRLVLTGLEEKKKRTIHISDTAEDGLDTTLHEPTQVPTLRSIAHVLELALPIHRALKGTYMIAGLPEWLSDGDVYAPHLPNFGITHLSHTIIRKKQEFWAHLPALIRQAAKVPDTLYIQETAVWMLLHIQQFLSSRLGIRLRYEIQLGGVHTRLITHTLGLPYPVSIYLVHAANTLYRDPQSSVNTRTLIRSQFGKAYAKDEDTSELGILGPVLSFGTEILPVSANFNVVRGMALENLAALAYNLCVDLSTHAGRKPSSNPLEYAYYLLRDGPLSDKHGALV